MDNDERIENVARPISIFSASLASAAYSFGYNQLVPCATIISLVSGVISCVPHIDNDPHDPALNTRPNTNPQNPQLVGQPVRVTNPEITISP